MVASRDGQILFFLLLPFLPLFACGRAFCSFPLSGVRSLRRLLRDVSEASQTPGDFPTGTPSFVNKEEWNKRMARDHIHRPGYSSWETTGGCSSTSLPSIPRLRMGIVPGVAVPTLEHRRTGQWQGQAWLRFRCSISGYQRDKTGKRHSTRSKKIVFLMLARNT